MKQYCTQNNGDCSICSLVNYNRDCRNNPVWGGAREGAGRKPTGRKQRRYYVSDEEHEAIAKLIDDLRTQK